MSTLKASQMDRPIESAAPHVTAIDGAEQGATMAAFEALVEHSRKHPDNVHGILTPMHVVAGIPWLSELVPWLQDLANRYHIGNYVIIRETGEKVFESMPIYARLGMHLLFYGAQERRLVQIRTVEQLLREQSVKQGKVYDSPSSTASIPSFIATYAINLDELLERDITKYKCFNDFFTRKLQPTARTIRNPTDPTAYCSVADCRLTVYQSIDLARQFWIKGRHFTIPSLLNIGTDSPTALSFANSSIAIFRLAPADYHRFHSPVDAVVSSKGVQNVEGQYYTVNPQAVNQEFDVFTANVRSILYLDLPNTPGQNQKTPRQVAFVAIGALLVGSVKWTGGLDSEIGKSIKKGDELGYFAYGGSTVVVLFPEGTIEFDADLVKNSDAPVETLIKMGDSLGRAPNTGNKDVEDAAPEVDGNDKWKRRFSAQALKKTFSFTQRNKASGNDHPNPL